MADPSESAPQEEPAAGPVAAAPSRRIVLFGGSGFVGRRIVRALRDADATVVAAVRHPESKSGDRREAGRGSLEYVKADVTDADSVARAVAGADAVINLVGILYEKGPQTFPRIHEHGAGNVARAAKAAGVGRLVHMSALGASPSSSSAYARTKAAGENVVREAFPEATIVRPSIVFGPDDDFFNKFAKIARYSPALPLIGGGDTRFSPVFVDDVAQAFRAVLDDPERQGEVYELVGPRTYTFKQLMQLMLDTMGIRRFFVPLPFYVAELEGAVLEALPKPPLTRDQVQLLKSDNVAGGHRPGLPELGIQPTALESVLPTYIG